MGKVLPILFNTDMVRAIMDGRKKVTRRVVKKLPDDAEFSGWLLDSTCQEDAKDIGSAGFKTLKQPTEKAGCLFVKPPYQPGDILYVRETWQYLYELDGNEQIVEGTGKYYYAATDTLPFDTYVDSAGVTHEGVPWCPSIHMPKEAARIWLKVTDVRVERLQEITKDECIKEGIYPSNCRNCNAAFGCDTCLDEGYDELDKFVEVWNSTVKKSDLDKYGWDANPWVWVIEFERCDKSENM